MLQSGSFVSLGAGDPVQRRDRTRARDAEGRIQVDPLEPPEALDDSVDILFADLVDWSIVDRRGFSPYRYNEREVVRAWAENCPATRQFLMDNHVRFARINGTHSGGGLSRARGAVCFLMQGDRTDMRAGTITAPDPGWTAARVRTGPRSITTVPTATASASTAPRRAATPWPSTPRKSPRSTPT